MDVVVPLKDDGARCRRRSGLFSGWFLCGVLLFAGCNSTPRGGPVSESVQQKTFVLHTMPPGRARAILQGLNLGTVEDAMEPNAVTVSARASDLQKVATVLDLTDTREPFVVQTLAPAAMARTLPSNELIAQAIGNMAIGTFAVPPAASQTRAIIDVHGDSMVAIVPMRQWPDVRAIMELGPQAVRQHAQQARQDPASGSDMAKAISATQPPTATPLLENSLVAAPAAGEKPRVMASNPPPITTTATDPLDKTSLLSQRSGSLSASDSPAECAAGPQMTKQDAAEIKPTSALSDAQQDLMRGVLRTSVRTDEPAPVNNLRAAISLPDANEVLELSLPEKIELVQLLDLAGEYLHLDCVYDAEKIGNPMITLKLHSKLRSEMKVRDLYYLLETILKFRGLAMSRHEGNLVTIVPAAEAMEIDPQLVDPSSGAIQAGDVVVTRVFELQYVGVSSVTNLLQGMKLSVAVSPIPETQTLFVTCYARRMERIEQLVNMVDKPGRAKEFRFRQLKYTMAVSLARKVLSLAGELQDITITIGAIANTPASGPRPPRPGGGAAGNPNASPAGTGVYLDTDDRTNRMLMIGSVEQLDTVERLIDILDVPQQDLRTLEVYAIKHVEVEPVLNKLQALEIIGPSTHVAARGAKPEAAMVGASEGMPGEKPQVVLLEATNSLLINATREQHSQIRTVLGYIDVVPEDARTLKVYRMQYVDAEDMVGKLQEMEIMGARAQPLARITRSVPNSPTPAAAAAITGDAGALTGNDPQIVVLEATNSLLVNATALQHERIAALIAHIDTEARKEALPYEVYFLENQDPEQLAQVLNKLVQETITDPAGKIQKTVSKTEEPVTIIPDKNTFSLIVYASRKHQDWVSGLIEKLDKRRPQVLIDVTLVEITETEAFTYDLNLIAGIPDLTQTSGLTGTLVPGNPPLTSADIINRLAASDRSQFADFQSNRGDLTVFYGDKHINLLLQAMQSKNYGRILAKPKILVNDNEPGSIKTTDTTYVTRQSSVPVSSGGAGNEATLIVTSTDYQSYEAGITLDITPHISLGDLLRLDIQLTRSDFRETEDKEKPPNTTSSELKTTAFVPDGSTIILGGLLRLNQNKGGRKVPILGDIPLIGGLFRSINNKDTQSKLYIFVKTEIIRPAGVLTRGTSDLEAASERNRQAFERHEQEFQNYEDWPGIKSKPVEPVKVLEAR
jgi:type II secretory pathway component GspD/PulD (secretin)